MISCFRRKMSRASAAVDMYELSNHYRFACGREHSRAINANVARLGGALQPDDGSAESSTRWCVSVRTSITDHGIDIAPDDH